MIIPTHTSDELKDLIDSLPAYNEIYWHDEYCHDTVVNHKNLIQIGFDETTEGIYDYIQYFMNWIDGSLYHYEYCSDGISGPWEIGCDEPPVHTCATPPGFYKGWEDPAIEDIPF